MSVIQEFSLIHGTILETRRSIEATQDPLRVSPNDVMNCKCIAQFAFYFVIAQLEKVLLSGTASLVVWIRVSNSVVALKEV